MLNSRVSLIAIKFFKKKAKIIIALHFSQLNQFNEIIILMKKKIDFLNHVKSKQLNMIRTLLQYTFSVEFSSTFNCNKILKKKKKKGKNWN